MPATVRTEKPVLHISINPHPDDVLTDTELQEIAREYLDRLGYGNQPYMVYKHEDIDRHHLHIVTINVDESGRRLNQDFLFRRSERIRKDLERKYGLHSAERRGERIERPLCKVDVAAGDIKKQVGNIVKAVNRQYRFQSLGEYRALLSLYNVTVEEARGIVRGTGNTTGWCSPQRMMRATRRAIRSSPRSSASPPDMMRCKTSLHAPRKR